MKPTTVWTFLRILVKKGLAGYDVDGRTYVYYPLVEEASAANHAVNDLIDHIFAGSRESFASFILKNRYIDPDEIEELRGRIKSRKDKS